SRPHGPRPMTAHLTFGPAGLVSGALFVVVCASNSTPPSIVMTVASEPPLRKSRRLNSEASRSLMPENLSARRGEGDLNFTHTTQFRRPCPQLHCRGTTRRKRECGVGSVAPMGGLTRNGVNPTAHAVGYFLALLRSFLRSRLRWSKNLGAPHLTDFE